MSGWINSGAVNNKLSAMIEKAKSQADLPIKQRAKEAVQRMQNDAPVDTGALKNSIVAKETSKGTRIEVKAKYGWFIEHGTFKMPARPFFNPAIERMQADLKRDYRDFLKGLK